MRRCSVSRIALALIFSLALPWPGLAGGAAQETQGAALVKLDPLLRQEFVRRMELQELRQTPAASPLCPCLPSVTGPEGEIRIPCWIRLQPGAQFPGWLSTGFRGAGLATAQLTLVDILRLAGEPSVRTVHAAMKTKPVLDVSAHEIRADLVQGGSGTPPVYSGMTGTGIVVGIVDTGIDYRQADFQTGSGTRLLSLWDQTVASAGHAPARFNYGREWAPDQINSRACTEKDTEGHGTHVMGIAAGNGSATGLSQPAYTYTGIAPEASLVMVKTNFTSASIADGVDYIFGKARDAGMPAVVNLSLGGQQGPHDGTEELEQAMDLLAGQDRIVVAASGNEQADTLHAEAALAPGDSSSVTLVIPPFTPQPGIGDDYVLIDGYYPPSSGITLTIRGPRGAIVGPTAPGGRVDLVTGDGGVLVENAYGAGQGGHIFIQIYDKGKLSIPSAGTWRFNLAHPAGSGGTESAVIDFWMFASSIEGKTGPKLPPVFDVGETARKLVGTPAGADSVIAVGAYVTKTRWLSKDGNAYTYNTTTPLVVGDLAFFSNHGPRRDGVLKPDLAAPGIGIGSSLSRDYAPEGSWILPDGVHFITQGTSMAAPHVTGLVALMLQAYPHRAVQQIMTQLQGSSRADGFTGVLPNPAWGWGKVDAVAATQQETPVLLHEIAASQTGDEVLLMWRVPLDRSGLFFRVFRGTEQGPEELLEEVGPGPSYTFSETLPEGLSDPLYWLQPMEGGPRSEPLGPYRPERTEGVPPLTFGMTAPAPNPSLGKVLWSVTIPGKGEVECSIFDPGGRLVWQVRPGPLGPGRHEFVWEGRNRSGDSAPSGLYWIRSKWNRREAVQRVLRIRPTQE